MKTFFKNPYFPLEDRPAPVRYFLSFIPVLAAVLGYPLVASVVSKTPSLIHIPAVFLSAWLGGFVPGVASIIVCSLFRFSIPGNDQNLTKTLIFAVASFIVICMLTLLRKALRKAKEAVALKEDFLNLASHEFRTPLTALKLNLEVVHRLSHEENMSPAAQNLLSSSQRQVVRLERLIGAMMDVTHFDSGQLKLLKTNCDLQKIVHDVAASYNYPGIIIETGEGNFAGIWDRIRIEQIISNLIHNAIKYGHNKPINIELGKSENHLWFSVRDQGAGIKADDHQRIFERFQRANTCTDVQGLGLGLYLTKKLVEIHDGNIEVISKPGEGALFKVSLPV